MNERRCGLGHALVVFVVVVPAITDWVHGLLLTEFGIDFVSSAYRASLVLLAASILAWRIPRWLFFAALIALPLAVLELLVWEYQQDLKIAGDLTPLTGLVTLVASLIVLDFAIRRGRVNYQTILKSVQLYGLLVAGLLLSSLATGFGIPTYGSPDGTVVYGFGTQSFYLAGNVVGLTLILSLVASLWRTLVSHRLTDLGKSVLIALGGISLGTRTGIAASGVVLLCGVMAFVLRARRGLLIRMLVAAVGMGLIGGIALGVSNVVSQYPRMLEKADLLLAGNVRDIHIEAASRYIEDQDAVSELFGVGYYTYSREFRGYTSKPGTGEKVTAENDWIDVRAAYGWLGAVGIYLGLGLFLWTKVLVVRQRGPGMDLIVASLVAVLLAAGHSLIAGHVVFSAKALQSVAPFLLILLYAKRGQQRRLA